AAAAERPDVEQPALVQRRFPDDAREPAIEVVEAHGADSGAGYLLEQQGRRVAGLDGSVRLERQAHPRGAVHEARIVEHDEAPPGSRSSTTSGLYSTTSSMMI